MTRGRRRRRWFALAAALALAGTLAFPSAAAPLLGGPVDTTTEGGIELLPAAGSEYATVGPDGELAVDLTPGETGLNRGSVTDLGAVFYVRYTGEQYAEVWVTADSEAVAFEVDGRPAGSAAERVRVGPDEVVPVSVRVDATSGDDLDVGGLTVHSRVGEAEREPDGGTAETATAETTATADATEVSIPAVQRRGTAAGGSLSFALLAPTAGESVTLDTGAMVVAGDGERAAVLESLSVTAASGEATTVDVERVDAAAGVGPVPSGAADALGAVRVDASSAVDAATFRLAVDDAFLAERGVEGVGDLALYRQRGSGGGGGEWREVPLSAAGARNGSTVLTGTTDGFSTFVLAAERPAVSVSEASVSPAAVSANESAAVTATVTNDGGAAAERTLAVTVGGEVVAERAVALAPGEAATVTASVSPGPGEHAVTVGGVDAGTLTVASAGSGGASGGGDSSDGSEAASGDGAGTTSSDGEPGADALSEPAGFDFEALAGAGVAVAVAVVGVGVLRRRRGGEP